MTLSWPVEAKDGGGREWEWAWGSSSKGSRQTHGPKQAGGVTQQESVVVITRAGASDDSGPAPHPSFPRHSDGHHRASLSVCFVICNMVTVVSTSP